VPDRDEVVVVDPRAVAAAIELRVHVRRGTEQYERLIDQVGAEIEEEPARFFWRGQLAPAP
jgi:hypothetical protein